MTATGQLPATPPGTGVDDLVRRAEPVMGTVVSIHVRPGPVPPAEVHLAVAEARFRLHKADAVFSTWKAHSPVSRLRRGEAEVADLPGEVREVLELCARAREMSGGWFDPWAAPGGVDPTGLVKGWAADRALSALLEAGVAAAMVSAGGDVAVWGERSPGTPWRIGVQNPFDRHTLAAVARPQIAADSTAGLVGRRAAIATSGSYERGLHVYDPFTGRPASAVASATVTGPRLDLADALATALLAGGEAVLPHLEASEGYEALLIRHDRSQLRTAAFPVAAPGS